MKNFPVDFSFFIKNSWESSNFLRSNSPINFSIFHPAAIINFSSQQTVKNFRQPPPSLIQLIYLLWQPKRGKIFPIKLLILYRQTGGLFRLSDTDYHPINIRRPMSLRPFLTRNFISSTWVISIIAYAWDENEKISENCHVRVKSFLCCDFDWLSRRARNNFSTHFTV